MRTLVVKLADRVTQRSHLALWRRDHVRPRRRRVNPDVYRTFGQPDSRYERHQETELRGTELKLLYPKITTDRGAGGSPSPVSAILVHPEADSGGDQRGSRRAEHQGIRHRTPGRITYSIYQKMIVRGHDFREHLRLRSVCASSSRPFRMLYGAWCRACRRGTRFLTGSGLHRHAEAQHVPVALHTTVVGQRQTGGNPDLAPGTCTTAEPSSACRA